MPNTTHYRLNVYYYVTAITSLASFTLLTRNYKEKDAFPASKNIDSNFFCQNISSFLSLRWTLLHIAQGPFFHIHKLGVFMASCQYFLYIKFGKPKLSYQLVIWASTKVYTERAVLAQQHKKSNSALLPLVDV